MKYTLLCAKICLLVVVSLSALAWTIYAVNLVIWPADPTAQVILALTYTLLGFFGVMIVLCLAVDIFDSSESR